MAADAAEPRTSTVVHLPNGRFAPGNPGRKPGSKNRVSTEAIAAIKDMKDEAIEQLRTKLRRGDWDALSFVLERIVGKGRVVELDGDMSPDTIAAAFSEGLLTPVEAKDIATALARLSEVGEIAELRAKLDELEKRLGGDGEVSR
ncbi:MAG: hypothetical protein E5X76_32020 [Mesorhizobium sp.]|nr:MAG: hypothetical protein E5X76_32020 [Mesorhizobium sp.]